MAKFFKWLLSFLRKWFTIEVPEEKSPLRIRVENYIKDFSDSEKVEVIFLIEDGEDLILDGVPVSFVRNEIIPLL
jgi:hypothetical protein